MAGQIPFSIMENILMELGSSAVQEIGLVWGVQKEITKLEETLGAIKAVLLDAEQQQEKSHSVQHWVRRLKDIVYDADDLLDDFATHQLQGEGRTWQVRDFFSCLNQVAFRHKVGHGVKRIRQKLDGVANDITKFNFTPRERVRSWVETSRRETHSFVLASEIVGRDESKEEIIKFLLASDRQENLSVVAIVGVGGLGKTTLAQLVYNDERVTEYFEIKIWVCVSEDFDVKALVKKILKSISNEDVEGLDLNGLKDRVHGKLNQKRYLLVLDDVWNEKFKKWDDLRVLLMVGATGSQIVVTSRNARVASVMGVNSPFILKGLGKNESWDLFSKVAFRDGEDKVHPNLVEIGKEIAKMCNGVPLVIKTLGTMLQFKTEENEWLFIKNNKNLLSLREGDDILCVLKLSYDDLPAHLKQCFAYCALFPKDYAIEKKMLVQLWIAQGYIQLLDGNQCLEDVGNRYFEELLLRSLLHQVGKDVYDRVLKCKMHDLIHDLAQSIMKSEILILRDDVNDISKRVRHLSLAGPLNEKALEAKLIRTFVVLSPHDNADDITVNTLIRRCKSLRALNLNMLKLGKVPKSLANLGHLRYLDLSYNAFEVLPNAITKLKNLQTLKLVGCGKLKEFPKDTRKLINLRHLENNGCRELTHMPSGIGDLTLLQSLSVFVVGDGRGCLRGCKIGSLSELKRLNHLRGELQIKNLVNVRNAAESKGEYLKEKQYLESLKLEWGRGEQEAEDVELVMEDLQPHSNLKELHMHGYDGGRFPSWIMNDGLGSLFPNLVEVKIWRCWGCQILPPFSQLPALKSLEINGLDVEYMMESSSGMPFFPSLQILLLKYLPNLKGWRREVAAEQEPSFPRLSKLEISNCHMFASSVFPSCPTLTQFEIICCHFLTSLVLSSSPCLSKLEIKYCGSLEYLTLPALPHLFQLHINGCSVLKSLSLPSAACLSRLEISNCPYLTSFRVLSSPCLEVVDLYMVGAKLLQQLTFLSSSLKSLSIWDIRDLISLPKDGLQHLTTLQTLTIRGCCGLETLLDWICSLTSLTELQIDCCPDLTSLPEEMRSLATLRTLKIYRCPHLLERCRRETGEDWPKIAHVPQINIQRRLE